MMKARIKEPEDYVKLWLRQNDAVCRLADQKAFDALPEMLRKIVNDSPIQLSCAELLLGCRCLGAERIAAAARVLLAQWEAP